MTATRHRSRSNGVCAAQLIKWKSAIKNDKISRIPVAMTPRPPLHESYLSFLQLKHRRNFNHKIEFQQKKTAKFWFIWLESFRNSFRTIPCVMCLHEIAKDRQADGQTDNTVLFFPLIVWFYWSIPAFVLVAAERIKWEKNSSNNQPQRNNKKCKSNALFFTTSFLTCTTNLSRVDVSPLIAIVVAV